MAAPITRLMPFGMGSSGIGVDTRSAVDRGSRDGERDADQRWRHRPAGSGDHGGGVRTSFLLKSTLAKGHDLELASDGSTSTPRL